MSTEKTNRSKPILILIIATLALLAIAGLIIHSLGYRYIKTDSAKFSGWTKNGLPSSGSIRYENGLSGKLITDKETGDLFIEYSTGDVYRGDLKGIVRHGVGVLTYANGDVYDGEFENDERSGEALISYADGSKYIGTVSDSLPHGKGIYTFSDSSWYYGDFENGLKHGVGEYHDADGSYYYGSYKDDLRHGTESVTIELYDKSEYRGKCKLVFSSGSAYVGDFVNDKRTGKGVYTWSSGERYEGEFKDGKFNGNGSYYFSDDTAPSYTGLFKDGKIAEDQDDIEGSDNNG